MDNEFKPLTGGMTNVDAYGLGYVFFDVLKNERAGVGDHIDAGLILRRFLKERGFYVSPIEAFERYKAMSDLKEDGLLGKLKEMETPGIKWICRMSSMGRGLRLHQDQEIGKYDTPQEAIESWSKLND